MIKKLQSYKDKNKLRTFKPENKLKNKNAEPQLKKTVLIKNTACMGRAGKRPDTRPIPLRTGEQGRKCAFSHFFTHAYGRINGWMDKGSYRIASPKLKTRGVISEKKL